MQSGLTQILKDNFGATEEQLASAIRLVEEKGGDLGEILINRKIITEDQLLEARSLLYSLVFWPSLPLDNISTRFTENVPIGFLKKHVMVPLDKPSQNSTRRAENGPSAGETAAHYYIAVNDPSLFQAADDLAKMIGYPEYRMVLSSRREILSAINMAYDFSRDSAEQLVQDMEETGSTIISEIQDTADLLDDTSSAPIIKLVNHILYGNTRSGVTASKQCYPDERECQAPPPVSQPP